MNTEGSARDRQSPQASETDHDCALSDLPPLRRVIEDMRRWNENQPEVRPDVWKLDEWIKLLGTALREGSSPKGECPPGPNAEHAEPGPLADAPKEEAKHAEERQEGVPAEVLARLRELIQAARMETQSSECWSLLTKAADILATHPTPAQTPAGQHLLPVQIPDGRIVKMRKCDIQGTDLMAFCDFDALPPQVPQAPQESAASSGGSCASSGGSESAGVRVLREFLAALPQNLGSTRRIELREAVQRMLDQGYFAESAGVAPTLTDEAQALLAAERERLCAAIKAADDKASEEDYMLDSDDCIRVIRGTWGLKDTSYEPD